MSEPIHDPEVPSVSDSRTPLLTESIDEAFRRARYDLIEDKALVHAAATRN